MMEAPKSYESKGYRFDLVYSNQVGQLSNVNEATESAWNIGLYTMVVLINWGGYTRFDLHYYQRSKIEKEVSE